MNRRQLIKHTALAGLLAQFPTISKAAASNRPRYLIVIQLAGGNDSLSSVIPYTNSLYYQARPTLGIAPETVLPISKSLGLHPHLKGIAALMDNGDGQVMQNIGYPHPNRSHFTSTDVWESGSVSARPLQKNGWYSRNPFLQQEQPSIADAVALSRNSALCQGGGLHILHMNNLKNFTQAAKQLALDTEDNTSYSQLKQSVKRDALKLQDKLAQIEPESGFKETPFQKQLAEVTKMIKVGGISPLFLVSLNGFDTHVSQTETYAELMTDFDQGISHMIHQLKEAGLWSQVTIMTYSEFGRRVQENANEGTDHGTAASHFIFNNRVKTHLVGHDPDLNNLENGDLRYQIHLNDYYQHVMQLTMA